MAKTSKNLLGMACLAVVSTHAGVLVSAWAPPLTLGYMTFIFGGSNGFAKSAVLVDASQAGMTFAVTFTGLSGKVAGRPAVSTTTSWYGGYCPMEAALPRPSATPAPSLESTSMETLRRGA